MFDDEVNTMALQRVLYLENDPAVRDITAMILESLNGLTLETCDSLMELALKVKSFQPDVILLDSVLSGPDTAETLADLCCDGEVRAPLVVIAAADKAFDPAYWQDLGASGFIPKSFDPMMLADELRNVCHDLRRDASRGLRAV